MNYFIKIFVFTCLLTIFFSINKLSHSQIGLEELEGAMKPLGITPPSRLEDQIEENKDIQNNFERENYKGINTKTSQPVYCEEKNLSQEQLVECEFQKTFNSGDEYDEEAVDWSTGLTTEDIIQNIEDQENAKREAIRLKSEKEHAEKIRKIEKRQAEIEKKRAKRNDSSSKWGINFKMTEKERSNICADKTSECYKNSLEHDDCERHPPFRLDGIVSKFNEKNFDFVDSICRNFGQHTYEKWQKIETKLKSKYKLLIPKVRENISNLQHEELYFALYRNESNNKEPRYIEIRLDGFLTSDDIYIVYHSKDKGEQIVKFYKDEEKIIDDL